MNICELESEKEIFREKEDNFDLKLKAIVLLDGNRTSNNLTLAAVTAFSYFKPSLSSLCLLSLR